VTPFMLKSEEFGVNGTADSVAELILQGSVFSDIYV